MEYAEFLSKIEYFKNSNLAFSLDHLTGVLTRQAMTDYVDYLAEQGCEFTLFLVDVDNFKNVNDNYGHPAGDIVLVNIAEYLVNSIGNAGVVGRYGGDEFMLVLEGITDYDAVWKYGHDIDMNIGSLVFDVEGAPNFAITVSIGISRCPIDARSYDDLLTISDKALYRAKMKGRNCFIIYLPEKHAHISLKKERDKRMTSMQMVHTMMHSMTDCGEDVVAAISNVFNSLCANFMYDHICIETKDGLNFNVIHTLSQRMEFMPVSDYSLLPENVNYAGNIRLSARSALVNASFAKLLREYKKHKLSSTLYSKISAYGVDYGFIRIDTANTARIWQNTEVSIVMMVANTIGLLLHYQHKTLEDLPKVPDVVVGAVN